MRDSGVQVCFLSVLLVNGQGFERASRTWQINKWLQDWCHSQGFRYLDHGNCLRRLVYWGLMGSI